MNKAELARQDLLWLEGTQSHYHTGVPAEIKVSFGPRMKPERVLAPEEVTVYCLNQRGEKRDLVPRKKEKNWLVFSFLPEAEGAYNVVAERHGEGRHYLAKTIVTVGHDLTLAPGPVGLPLELHPSSPLDVHLGDSFTLTLLQDGSPVIENDVLATYSFNLEETFPYGGKTGGDGRVTFHLEKMGNWLFVAKAGELLSTFTLLRVR